MAKNGKDKGILELPKGSGKWWVRIFVNGREKRHRADNKTQAKVLYGRLKADIREGKYFPEKFNQTQEITLRAWIDRCLEGFTQLKGYRNQKRYGKWWKLLLGKRLLSQITTEEIARIQAKVLNKEIRSPQTMNRYLAFLKHILNLAVKDGKIDRNPVCSVKFSPEPQGRLRFLSEEEIKTLKEKMAPDDWKMVAFSLETGLRQSEQFKARWEWIDMERGILTIPHSKSGRTRHVPLSDGALALLRSLSSWMISPFLFASPLNAGKPRDGRSFMVRIYLPALEKAKIEGVTWHTLRHSFASRLVMKGVDIRTIQELMGHSTIMMTMRYAHLSPEHLREAVNRASLTEIGVGTVTKTVTKGDLEEKTEDTKEAKTTDVIDENIGGGGRDRTAESQFCRLLP